MILNDNSIDLLKIYIFSRIYPSIYLEHEPHVCLLHIKVADSILYFIL